MSNENTWPLEAQHKRDLDAACELVIARGWTTGHADTCVQLMTEVLEQAYERISLLEEEVSRLRQGERSCDC